MLSCFSVEQATHDWFVAELGGVFSVFVHWERYAGVLVIRNLKTFSFCSLKMCFVPYITLGKKSMHIAFLAIRIKEVYFSHIGAGMQK